ncbi:class I SAM-dependent methyltransferase, partial [bacterium]
MSRFNSVKMKGKRILIKILSRLPVSNRIIARIRRLESQLAQNELEISHLEALNVDLNRRLSSLDAQSVVENFFGLLEGDQSYTFWQHFHKNLCETYDVFSDSLGKNIPQEDLVHLLSLLLIPIARNGLKDQATGTRLFYIAESMDVHILPVHYYSPLPHTTEIPQWNWQTRFEQGVDFNVQSQLRLISLLHDYAKEMTDIRSEYDENLPNEFYWNNPAFGAMDAVIYYSMIRHFKPKRVLEVGGGYSSLVALKARRANIETIVDVIEPYPLDFLKSASQGLNRLIKLPVQEVPMIEFECLAANDILFIDSTHISKSGSDVNWIILNILPRLKPGVIIHFHDITLPWDYPREWVQQKRIFYNEQFLLLALLINNPAFEILLSNYLLGAEHSDELQKAFPFLSIWGGGSF